MSLHEGLFVPTWKTAVIRPLLKKTGLDLISSNYGPVSNLTFLSKVLEKAVLQQFNHHCNVNNLMPDYQSAYRPGYSCETALVKLMNELLWSMEKQENISTRIVLGSDAPESNRECLKMFHWLPIDLRVKFYAMFSQVLCLVYKSLHNDGPIYMREMLKECIPSRTLRSNNIYKKLEIPLVKKQTFANRSFSVQGPKWWNILPNFIKQAQSLETFKKYLKTHLFNEF